VSALGDENVCGLDVAMDNALAVRCVERVGDFDCQGKQNLGFQGTSGDAMLQGQAVEEFHGDERMSLVLADVMNGADIRMIESGSGLGFALEAGQRLGVFGDVVGKEFEGDEAVEAGVFGLVDYAHSAAA
jgi:hypothetical protein